MKEHLDRGVANSEWRGPFLDMEEVVEVTTSSNHTPLILYLLGDGVHGWGHRNFRYETKWQCDEGYEEVLKQAWAPITDVDNGWRDIGSNLSRCQSSVVQ
jgi:hypothetical protein